MEKQNKFNQLKSIELWKGAIAIGFGLFGIISATIGILGFSFIALFKDIKRSIVLTMIVILCSYIIAVLFLWWNTRDKITLKIRGIKITVYQGDILKQSGWKVIGIDDAFTVTENDAIITHFSLHGKLIKQLKENNESEVLKEFIAKNQCKI